MNMEEIMEIRNVESFLKIAELGQFSKAADALGYAQSTVTAQIHQLEDDLGAPLFERSNTSVKLTEFGREFLPLAQKMHNLTVRMSMLSMKKTDVSGNLRIGCIESLYYSGFLNLLPDFARRFPKVSLEFFTGASMDLHRMLMENQVDLILSLIQPVDYSSLEVVFQRHCDVVFAAGPGNPLAGRTDVTLAEIAAQPLIMTEEVSIYHRELHRIFTEEDLKLIHRFRMQSSRAIKELTRSMDSICFLPRYALQKDVDRGRLTVLDTDFPAMETEVVSVMRKEDWHSPQMRAMIELIRGGAWLTADRPE